MTINTQNNENLTKYKKRQKNDTNATINKKVDLEMLTKSKPIWMFPS